MKKSFFVLFFGLLFTASCAVYVTPPYEEGPPSGEEYYEEEYGEYPSTWGISHFYDALSPYGMWVYYPPYRYVWVPNELGYRWRPYTRGRWIWTDYGWMWVSKFKWGWIPFHYGRWGWDRDLGWFWVPGTLWGPAWVTWRRSNLYIGWSPLLPPSHFIEGVGIRSLPYSPHVSYWVFVEGRYFLNSYLYRYILPFERNVTVINYTVHKTNIYVRNNRIINEGIGLDHVRKFTRNRISKYQLQEAKRPGSSRISGANQVKVYKPSLVKERDRKPRKVSKINETKLKRSKAKISKLKKVGAPLREEPRLKEVHKRQLTIMKRSQQKELDEMKRKIEEEKKATRNSSEKKKVEREGKRKLIKLKSGHEKEKAQIEKRHEEEKKKVKKKIKKISK